MQRRRRRGADGERLAAGVRHAGGADGEDKEMRRQAASVPPDITIAMREPTASAATPRRGASALDSALSA
jgi:hypothetical protein